MLRFYLRTAAAMVLAVLTTGLLVWLLAWEPADEQAERLLQGHAVLHAQTIAQTPPAERRAAVQRLSVSLGYGVHTEQRGGATELHMDFRAGNLFLVAPVPDTPGQLVFGPLPYRSPSVVPLAVFFTLGVALLVAWLTLLPLMRRVRSIEGAATQMCRGDFAVRTHGNDAGDMLDGIGQSLNELSERIGQLLSDERDLVRTVAHEVRAPIARMRFRVERILEQAGEGGSKDANGLVSDLQRVDNLFDELLTYVAFDEFDYERPALQTTEVDVFNTVQRLVGEVTATDAVDVCVHGSEGVLVSANPKLFDRAVTNLLLNAMAYGEGRIEVFVREFPRECVVDVQDNGLGIPEVDRPRVIKPFVRLSKKKTRGTGLGLAIVKRIMNLHRGSLHIVNAPGGGASIQLVWRNAKGEAHSSWLSRLRRLTPTP